MIFTSDIPSGRQDFDNTVRNVTFNPNSGVGTEMVVNFPVIDDIINEDPEGFIIVLDVDMARTAVDVAFTSNLRTTLGRINDDDRESLLISLSVTIPLYYGIDYITKIVNGVLRESGPCCPLSVNNVF